VICDDFRARWSDRDPVDSGATSVDADLASHRAACEACATFAAWSESFDAAIGAVVFVSPPPDLALRLQALTAPAPLVAPRPVESESARAFGLALEFAAFVFLGLGALALVASSVLGDWELAIGRLGDVLQGISLVFSSPVVPYVQNLAFTGVEALATLLLLVMGFDRISTGLFGAPMKRDAAE
jgi:hypothetical protein